MTQKRTLEEHLTGWNDLAAFHPAKCLKQCASFSCKGPQERVQQQQQDEVVDAYDVEHSPRKPCPQESFSVSKDALEKDARDNSSSQEHSSLELCHLQESSASSPAPCRFFQQQFKTVPIGGDYQADVPDWNPNLRRCRFREESVWAGERVWPICEEDVDCCSQSRVGKGRDDDECSCSDRGSVECVRTHIEEEKCRLMDELGPAYDHSGFDEMGESVARHWTESEQAAFREVVRQNPASMGKNFWHNLALAFPARSTMELVSYYFNVFVLRRRSIQNRLYPEDPDSDNDEQNLPSRVSDWTPSDDEEEEYDDYEHYERPAATEVVDDYESDGDDEDEVGEVVYVGYDYDSLNSRDMSTLGQIREQDVDVMSHSFDDHKGELAESFMRSSDREMENMRRALPDSWMGALDWNSQHSSSSRHSASAASSFAPGGNSSMELASTNGALQEFFGSDQHQFLVDDKQQQQQQQAAQQFF